MSEETWNFVSATEEYPLYDSKSSCLGDLSRLTDDEVLLKYMQQEHGTRCLSLRDLVSLLPGKLLLALFLTCFSVGSYYLRHCTLDTRDGSHQLVSKTMYKPSKGDFGWLHAF